MALYKYYYYYYCYYHYYYYYYYYFKTSLDKATLITPLQW